MCQTFCKTDSELGIFGAFGDFPANVFVPKYYDATLTKVHRLTKDVMVFNTTVSGDFRYRSGQFAMVQIPGVKGWRAYSMSSMSKKAVSTEFLIKRVFAGEVSDWLFNGSNVGNRIRIFGPLGSSILKAEEGDQNIFCICGGSGIAGIMAIIEDACVNGYLEDNTMEVFFGLRSEKEGFLLDRLSGFIKKASDDSTFEEIDVTSSQVTGTGTSVIKVNPSSDLASTTQYYVQIDASAFDDSSGNSFAGISDKTSLNFTSADIEAPSLSSSTPADDATGIPVNSDIELTFSESVDVETGKIYIKKTSDDSLFEEIDVTSSQVTGTGTNVITINPANDFASTTQYYVQIEDSAFDGSSGNSFVGISDKTSLNFTSADIEPPILSSSTPADDTANLSLIHI